MSSTYPTKLRYCEDTCSAELLVITVYDILHELIALSASINWPEQR
jgi:hypothetical protein